jgi:hypothetical protein
MNERIDELDLFNNKVGDYFNRREGVKQAKNISNVLMKKYMEYLGRNKLKANPGTLSSFFQRTVEDGDTYSEVAMQAAVDIAKQKAIRQRQAYQQQKARQDKAQQRKQTNQPPPNPPPAGATNNSNPNSTGGGGSAGASGNSNPNPTDNGGDDDAPPAANLYDNKAINQASNIINRDLLNPAKEHETLQLIKLLVQAGIKYGGKDQEEVHNWLMQLKQNPELAKANPQLFQALTKPSPASNPKGTPTNLGKTNNGQPKVAPPPIKSETPTNLGKTNNGQPKVAPPPIKSESFNRAINFASFLVEYDLRTRDAFNGALQFLNEVDVKDNDTIVTDSNGVSTVKSKDDYAKELRDTKLSRSEIMQILYKVAAEMVNSGDFYFDSKEGKDNNYRQQTGTKPHNTGPGEKPNLRKGRVDLYTFEEDLKRNKEYKFDDDTNKEAVDYIKRGYDMGKKNLYEIEKYFDDAVSKDRIKRPKNYLIILKALQKSAGKD